MTDFDLDVYDLALESLEAPVDGDPIGPYVLSEARAWLVRLNSGRRRQEREVYSRRWALLLAPNWSTFLWVVAWVLLASLAGIEGATVTYYFAHGWTAEGWEAFAGILAALGTLVLAYYTWRSVSLTSESVRIANKAIKHDNRNQRIARTIDLMRLYKLTLIPLTSEISVTVQGAANNVSIYANDLDSLRKIKAVFEKGISSQEEDNGQPGREYRQYLLLKFAFGVIANFYLDVATLLEQGLLDESLLFERFAGEFISTYGEMIEVANFMKGPTIDQMTLISTDVTIQAFGGRCNAFLDKSTATATA